jgi:4-hydroxy-2-oxoheptanedioate aldolase
VTATRRTREDADIRPNLLKAAWRDGRATLGGWLTIDSGFSAELMAHQGFDWLCVDMQHGLIDFGAAVTMLQAISTTDVVPLVRVPWNEPAAIMQALDAGAYGVIVPLVSTAEEASRAVEACRYPPDGIRSSGAARGALYGGADYARHANEEIACVVMIETAEALENLDAILSTPGVDAAYVGPSDLAYALGVEPTGDNADPRHVEAVANVLEACRRHGVTPGIHTHSAEYSRRYIEQGYRMVMLGADGRFLRTAAAELTSLRDLVAAPGTSG